jgi:predicted dinucleotide-binding enzyme
MDVGILGTGIVGQTIGTRLVDLGHNVKLGSRSANNEKARAWPNALANSPRSELLRMRRNLAK